MPTKSKLSISSAAVDSITNYKFTNYELADREIEFFDPLSFVRIFANIEI